MTKQQDIPATWSPDWLEKLDGRTTLARVVNERVQCLATDLGGMDALSYQQRSLCKRIVWIEAVIEKQEAALARGEDVDQGRMTQAVNSLVGLLKAVGLERRAKPVQTLNQYLAQHKQGADV